MLNDVFVNGKPVDEYMKEKEKEKILKINKQEIFKSFQHPSPYKRKIKTFAGINNFSKPLKTKIYSRKEISMENLKRLLDEENNTLRKILTVLLYYDEPIGVEKTVEIINSTQAAVASWFTKIQKSDLSEFISIYKEGRIKKYRLIDKDNLTVDELEELVTGVVANKTTKSKPIKKNNDQKEETVADVMITLRQCIQFLENMGFDIVLDIKYKTEVEYILEDEKNDDAKDSKIIEE